MALICLILSLFPIKVILSGKINVYQVLHMLANVWSVGGYTCGQMCGNIIG